MKTTFNISVLALLLVVAPSPCFALRGHVLVSKEQAKEMGLEVRATAAGPEAAWVELEFKPEGKLKDFHRVEMEIFEGEKLLVAYAPLQEKRLDSGRVRVRFMVNRAFLEKVTLCVVVGLDLAYDIRLKDFVEPEKLR